MKKYRLLKDLPTFKAGTECYIDEVGNMVPCRGISYIIVHNDQLEKNPDVLDDWFEEINEPTRWEPEEDQKYYFASSSGIAFHDFWTNSSGIDNGRFEIGNCFQTKEEAEQAVGYLKALATVRGDATSKFVEGDSNWFVYFDSERRSLRSTCIFHISSNGIFGLPYFATEDDAQRSIWQHKNEWLTIFGVKEEL